VLIAEPLWSADGRFLYLLWHDCLRSDDCYVKLQLHVTAIDVANGLSHSLLQSDDPEERLVRAILSPDGSTLYLGLSNRLLALSATDGVAKTLLQYDRESQAYKDFDLSRDGQRIAYLQRMEVCKTRRDIEGRAITPECRHDFFVMNVDGRQHRQLTTGFLYSNNIYWFGWWQPSQGID